MALVHNKSHQIITVGISDRDTVRLMTGINEVEDFELIELKKHPIFMARVEADKIEIIGDVKIGSDGKKSVESMLKYIPKIFDTKLLRKIIKEDGRDLVVNCAKDQLDTIVNPNPVDQAKNEHFK